MQSVLVVGGAGYIGSHTVNQLIKNNFKVVVVDDLSTGSKLSLSKDAEFYQVDILNVSDLRKVFSEHKFDAIFHFAAKLSVPESFKEYDQYFSTNVVGTKNLLQLCSEFSVNHFVFSSTAAVYGDIRSSTVDEGEALAPQNPYGFTKKIAESLIEYQAKLNPHFKYQILRYFNVAGAELDLSNGPRNLNSGQLILNLCLSALGNKNISIFGNDYKTKDGTAVRDFIHVVDLASAHIQAYKALGDKKESGIWNCGYGQGFTVLEVIKAFEAVNNINFNIKYDKARIGDPAQVISNNAKIMKESNWIPVHNDLSIICKSTYQWILNAKNSK